MSEYYKPIDISKFNHSVPDEIKELGDRELTEKDLKELSLIPSGVSDIAKATFGVGKAALDIGGDTDKDKQKKDKEAEKEKELDYDQYAKFLENGFKNYSDQYFVHPVIFVNEKKRKIGYTVLSMVTGSSITLQPYKLADNDLYKLATQVLPGKLRTIIQKLFSWFNYERVYYKKMDVTNISSSKDPVRSFKMDQILKEPVYKELNKFNPKRGEKYTCGFIFYDDNKRKLIYGKDIAIDQVTQDKLTLSKIHAKEVKKGGTTETKFFLKKYEVSLSMIIPAYLSDIAEDKMKEKHKFSYNPIFPMTVSSSEDYEKMTGLNLTEGLWDKVKGALKPKPTTLVLFYLKPLLLISESEKELDSFRGDMDTFNFDTHKRYISSLSALIYGEDRYDRGGGGGSPVKKVDLSKLRKFYAKYGARIRLYGWTPKLRAILLRYAMRPNYSVYDYIDKSIFKEKENEPVINKEELITSIRKNELPVLDLQYIREEPSADEREVYFVFKVLNKSGDESSTEGIVKNKEIRIPSSYFEHIELIKDNSGNEIPSAFIDESFFEETASKGNSNTEESEESDEEEPPVINSEFSNNRNAPPSQSTTNPDSVDEIISDTPEIQTNAQPEEIVDQLQTVINDIEGQAESQEQSVEDTRKLKILKLYQEIENMVVNTTFVDIIELDDTKISDRDDFSNRIIDSQSIEEFADLLVKKYQGQIRAFNVSNEKDYFVIDNIKEEVIPKPENTQPQQSKEEPKPQNNNVPDINNREGDITYYKVVDGNNLDDSEIVEPTNKRAFYEGWKQGNNYYVNINPNNPNHLSILESDEFYLDPLFEYKKDKSAKKIKNIKPAVFDLSTKKLIEKGQVELL